MTMNATAVEIAKLALVEGDVLAVMVPTCMHAEQRDNMMAVIEPMLPAGVKALILDGGATLAKISGKD